MSTAQLRALGFSPSAISRQVVAGRLHRVYRGVFAVGHRALAREGLALGGVLASGEGALLSHLTAAWLWGLRRRWPAVVEVTACSPRRHRNPLRVHSDPELGNSNQAVIDGIPVTSVPRTLLDVAGTTHVSIPALLDRAERLGVLDVMEISALLEDRRGHRGAARLRAALDPYRRPAFVRSGLERRFLEITVESGLPRPSMNQFVAGYELDAYWPNSRFAVELDSLEYHGGHRAFEADRLRSEDLKLAGIEMTRITAGRLEREPRAVLGRLRLLLDRRNQELQRLG